MTIEITPPNQILSKEYDVKVFLAGTIDNGDSEDWQRIVSNTLSKDFNSKGWTNKRLFILNPRRVEWDASWEQSFESPEFFQQVTWEMDAMEKANLIIMNFLPESKSPISLLELGLFANSKKIMVCCPDEFYRSGNVQIVCNKFNIPLFKTMPELLKNIINYNLL